MTREVGLPNSDLSTTRFDVRVVVEIFNKDSNRKVYREYYTNYHTGNSNVGVDTVAIKALKQVISERHEV